MSRATQRVGISEEPGWKLGKRRAIGHLTMRGGRKYLMSDMRCSSFQVEHERLFHVHAYLFKSYTYFTVCGGLEVRRVHPPSVQNKFTAVHSIVVKIFQTGWKWWFNQPTNQWRCITRAVLTFPSTAADLCGEKESNRTNTMMWF